MTMQPEPKNEIAKATESTMRELFKSPEVLEQFENILGKANARHYVGSVFIAVANSLELQECHPDSIIRSALRAAAFELSCDPAAKQGQLVPYWNSKRGRKEAQFIPHYKGMYTLALRSGLYRVVNVSEIYKGYIVAKDMLTGIHSVTLDTKEFDPKVTIGYLGYFETKTGLKKSVYWGIERIEAHARQFAPKNPLYAKNSPHYKTMLEKTVWRDLLSWADLGGTKTADLTAVLDDEDIDGGPDLAELETLEGKAVDLPAEAPAAIDPEEVAYAEACEVLTQMGARLGDKSGGELIAISKRSDASDEQKKAAKIIMDYKAKKSAKIEQGVQNLF